MSLHLSRSDTPVNKLKVKDWSLESAETLFIARDAVFQTVRCLFLNGQTDLDEMKKLRNELTAINQAIANLGPKKRK